MTEMRYFCVFHMEEVGYKVTARIRKTGTVNHLIIQNPQRGNFCGEIDHHRESWHLNGHLNLNQLLQEKGKYSH